MTAKGVTVVVGLWFFFLVGAFLNIYQVILGFLALEVVSEISNILIIKTILILFGPVGSIFGWVGLFS
jgi:hypothetical protein